MNRSGSSGVWSGGYGSGSRGSGGRSRSDAPSWRTSPERPKEKGEVKEVTSPLKLQDAPGVAPLEDPAAKRSWSWRSHLPNMLWRRALPGGMKIVPCSE